MVRWDCQLPSLGEAWEGSLKDDAGIGRCLIQKDDSLVMCSALKGP